MLTLPFDTTCRSVDDCLDLYMSSNQCDGCECPVCEQPTARHRSFQQLPNTLLLQIQLLNDNRYRRIWQVQHWFIPKHSLHDICMTALLLQSLCCLVNSI